MYVCLVLTSFDLVLSSITGSSMIQLREFSLKTKFKQLFTIAVYQRQHNTDNATRTRHCSPNSFGG